MKKIIILIFTLILVGCGANNGTTTKQNTTITTTKSVLTTTRGTFDEKYAGKYILKEFYQDNELIETSYEYNYIEISELGDFTLKNKINDEETILKGVCFTKDASIEFLFSVDNIEILNVYKIGENNTLIFEDNVGDSLVKLIYERE